MRANVYPAQRPADSKLTVQAMLPVLLIGRILLSVQLVVQITPTPTLRHVGGRCRSMAPRQVRVTFNRFSLTVHRPSYWAKLLKEAT